MKVFQIKHLLLISFFIFLGSCNIPKHLAPLNNGKETLFSVINFSPVFKGDFNSFLFKTSLTYGTKFEFGGMLMLKQISLDNYRVIFMTKFGMTMFDFEFGSKGFIVHKAFEQLNKKIFLKILKQDIGMLLSQSIEDDKVLVYEKNDGQNNKKVLKFKMNKKTHYFVQEKRNRISEIHRGRAVSLKLSGYFGNIPSFIDIQHHKVPLRMKLTLMKH
ncbi:MAG: hypothetical protein MK207_07980 [Saprospiraceae bacterium]|nr:hypothetical protein [Saprospiraceae bacterium]